MAEFAQNRINAIKKDPTLTMDEKLAEIKKWDEGGAYRVAAHTALGAFGTGTLEGALNTGGVAAAAPVINDLEQKMSDQLVEQGMSPDITKSTANAITSIGLAGVGTATGLDTSSTATAVNVDANNRQLHWSEMAKLNDSALALSKKYGRDANYWKAILYAVTYSHLDKERSEKLAWLKEELTGAAHIPASKEFVSIVNKDIAIAEATYKNLSNKYGTTKLAKDTHSSSTQNKPIYMFDESGYYNDNSIYGTYGSNSQGNTNNSKNFYKVAEGLQNQTTDIDTRNDRINPLYPELYYIPLSELKALGTAGVSGAKALVKKQTEKKAAVKNANVTVNTEYFIPEQKLRVSKAHSINTIDSNTRFGGGNRNTTKTIAKGNIDLNADINALNAGKGKIIDKTERLVEAPSGRIWSYHDASASGAYPVRGEGLVTVSQAEYVVLQQMIKSGGMKGNAKAAFEGMKRANNSGLSNESERKLIDLYNSRSK